MSSIRQHFWMAAVAAGLMFVVIGGILVWQGRNARNDIRDGLVAEQITTSSDATLFGVAAGIPVDNAKTAWTQAEVIHFHSLGGEDKAVVDGKIVGGVTYAQMERTDPARATYLDGVTLRTALTQAYMGFKITDLIMGLGGIFIVLGVALAGLLSPALYWARVPATERAERPTAAAQPGRPATAARA